MDSYFHQSCTFCMDSYLHQSCTFPILNNEFLLTATALTL